MKNHKLLSLLILLVSAGLLFAACSDNGEGTEEPPPGPPPVQPEDYDLDNFPEGSTPQEIGLGVAERFISLPHSYWGNINSDHTANHITYPDVCAWLGAFWFAESTGNAELYQKLVDKFEPLFTTQSNLQPNLNTTADNKVDYYVFGAVPLEIYKKRKEDRYKDLGMKYADGQWTLPAKPSSTEKGWHDQGYSWQTRLWIDDMFMITALQAQAYHITGDEKYIDRTAREMVLYLDRLQRENGLFYHAPNVPFYWARGDGWMAVGMTEVLRALPTDSKYDQYRERIMEGYLNMMEGLYRYQNYDGMWGQLIDDMAIWRETSGTAMFTYAMITGVRQGWLDKEKYGAAARKAWLGLMPYLTEDFDITEVCEGTGAVNSHSWYVNRRRWVGDTHGQAGMLWCAFALTSPQK